MGKLNRQRFKKFWSSGKNVSGNKEVSAYLGKAWNTLKEAFHGEADELKNEDLMPYEITADKIKDAHVRIFPGYTYDPTRKRKLLLEGKIAKTSPKICKKKKEDKTVKIPEIVDFLIPSIEKIKYEVEGSSLLHDVNHPTTQTTLDFNKFETNKFETIALLEPHQNLKTFHQPVVHTQSATLNNVEKMNDLPIDLQPTCFGDYHDMWLHMTTMLQHLPKPEAEKIFEKYNAPFSHFSSSQGFTTMPVDKRIPPFLYGSPPDAFENSEIEISNDFKYVII